MSLVDLTGKKFARWTVQSLCADSGKVKFWNCVCECGTLRRVFGGDLKRGGSLSCGCLMKEAAAERLEKHGMSFHPAYRSWLHARSRCNNVNDEGFKEYGGRGISFCERWGSFDLFWEDMGSEWRPGLSIERVDVNGNYHSDNCIWATPKQQANNRRTNRMINTPKGPMNVTQASEVFGVSKYTISSRLKAGWPEHRLLDVVQFNMRWHDK